MMKKTLELDFQTNLNSNARHFISRHSIAPENQKKIERRFSVFSVFVSGPFVPLVSILGQSDYHVLKWICVY